MQTARGYTLIELLCTLAIAALLVGVGYPSLKTFLREAQLSATVSTYLHAFNSARYAAVTAQRQISLCTLDKRGLCTGAWAGNLTLFFDDDRDGKLATAGDVVERITLDSQVPVDVSFRAFRTTRYVSLRANGQYRQNGTFRFCPRDGSPGRAIVINVAGRARSEKTSCPR